MYKNADNSSYLSHEIRRSKGDTEKNDTFSDYTQTSSSYDVVLTNVRIECVQSEEEPKG